jgi:hypothetical protein
MNTSVPARTVSRTRRLGQGALVALALGLALGAGAPALAADDPSIHEVYQAAEAGKMGEAQSMMDKVLRDHPNSAKAHYVEAELLAKQGRMGDARDQLATAERLDPALSFASPQAVRDLRNQIEGRSAVKPGYAVIAPAAAVPQSHFPWGSVILLVALVGVVVVVARAIARRNAVPAYGGFGRGTAYPAPNPGYGPQGPYPGYPPYGAPPAGGGVGSSIMGGLATGAAVGAGMVAGEALAHHFTDGDRGNTTLVPDNSAWGQTAGDSWGRSDDMRNADMGGNDFGMSDSSSWDDGGGGGDSGGGGDW